MSYFKDRGQLPPTMTAKQLSVHIRRTSEIGYEPNPKSIHQLMAKHSIKPTTRNGVNVYNTKNAIRCITQHIDELQAFDKNNEKAKTIAAQMSQNTPVNNQVQYVPRKHGETNAHRELDKETLYENNIHNSMNKKDTKILNESSLREIVRNKIATILKEKILGQGESFTPYTPEEKARNFEYLKTGFGRSAEERNPAYAAALKAAQERKARKAAGLEEDYSQSQQIDDAKKQSIVRQTAINALKQNGFNTIFGDETNYYTFKVSVNTPQDDKKVFSILKNALGVVDTNDLGVQLESRLGGSSYYCIVYLPPFNKVNIPLQESFTENQLISLIQEAIKKVLKF